ncbi:hypothetical protein ACFOZY_03400 [Chungangia koreensis]|uniref:Uncharacterized protein n=1 Tax=Chungangia koreensis TaxID=752657 RepID=A0ABV8X3E8_9LACT
MPFTLQSEPLLFIAGPPIFTKTKETAYNSYEESTSVYTKPFTPSRDLTPIKQQLQFLDSPFQRHVYRPLTFRLTDGSELLGVVDSLFEDHVVVRLESDTEDSELVEVHLGDLEKIVWQGKVFKV